MEKIGKILKNNFLFFASIILILIISSIAIIDMGRFVELINTIYSFCAEKCAWLYLLLMVFFVVVSFIFAFSKYGNVKLGNENDKPEYSNRSWFAMLFCAGMGVGLVFWGISEPISHYLTAIKTGTNDMNSASLFSFRTVFMHWGIHPWACYSIVGLSVAYFQYKKNKNGLISLTVANVIKNKALLVIVDFLSVFATIAGIVTSLGLGVLQVNSGLNYIFGIPESRWIQILIIVSITIIFVISAISGLNKGVKYLSNINLWLAILLSLICFLVGPKMEVLNNFTSGLGEYLSNIINDSLNINPYGDNGWIIGWRVFYWAWWIAWAPFVGMFIAKISKGRTIKEFVIGVVLIPTVASIIWFSIWGTLGLSLINDGTIAGDVVEIVANSPEKGLFIVLSNYPFGGIVSILTLILIICFFITSADSGTYVLASLTSNGSVNPSKNKKIVWGIIQAIFAILLLCIGGLKPLQTLSIVAALPFSFVMVIQIIALFKALKNEC